MVGMMSLHTYYTSYGKDWLIAVMELVETKYHLNLESLKSRRLRSLCHGKFGIDREKLNDVQLAEKLMKRIGGVWQ